MSPKKTAAKRGRGSAKAVGKRAGFTAAEREAMRERVRELKKEAGPASDGERDLLAKIAQMQGADRAMAQRIHEIIRRVAPDLTPRTWYGMPAWARDGKVVCFFQSAQKFKSRYATLGFSDTARLDDGAMWPTSFALKELTGAAESQIAELVKRAVS
jgi:uncharacterized protein YdhG (YjbR/CyaY superfamily)